VSVEWAETSQRLKQAQARRGERAGPSRALLVNCSPRNDGSCPGGMSKTYRLTTIAGDTLDEAGMHTDLLDLSWLTSDCARQIHRCKGCVSTAMPVCHWPCRRSGARRGAPRGTRARRSGEHAARRQAVAPRRPAPGAPAPKLHPTAPDCARLRPPRVK
jgi:hypothetical protein